MGAAREAAKAIAAGGAASGLGVVLAACGVVALGAGLAGLLVPTARPRRLVPAVRNA